MEQRKEIILTLDLPTWDDCIFTEDWEKRIEEKVKQLKENSQTPEGAKLTDGVLRFNAEKNCYILHTGSAYPNNDHPNSNAETIPTEQIDIFLHKEINEERKNEFIRDLERGGIQLEAKGGKGGTKYIISKPNDSYTLLTHVRPTSAEEGYELKKTTQQEMENECIEHMEERKVYIYFNNKENKIICKVKNPQHEIKEFELSNQELTDEWETIKNELQSSTLHVLNPNSQKELFKPISEKGYYPIARPYTIYLDKKDDDLLQYSVLINNEIQTFQINKDELTNQHYRLIIGELTKPNGTLDPELQNAIFGVTSKQGYHPESKRLFKIDTIQQGTKPNEIEQPLYKNEKETLEFIKTFCGNEKMYEKFIHNFYQGELIGAHFNKLSETIKKRFPNFTCRSVRGKESKCTFIELYDNIALLNFSQSEVARLQELVQQPALENNELKKELIQKIQTIDLEKRAWINLNFKNSEVENLRTFLEAKEEKNLSAKLLNNNIKIDLNYSFSFWYQKNGDESDPLHLHAAIFFQNNGVKIESSNKKITLYVPEKDLNDTIYILRQSDIEYSGCSYDPTLKNTTDPILKYIKEEYERIMGEKITDTATINTIFYAIQNPITQEKNGPNEQTDKSNLFSLIEAYIHFYSDKTLEREAYEQKIKEYRQYTYLKAAEQLNKILFLKASPNIQRIISKMSKTINEAKLHYTKKEIGTLEYIEMLKAANKLDEPLRIEKWLGKLGIYETDRYRRYDQFKKYIKTHIIQPWRSSKSIKIEALQSQMQTSPSDLNKKLKLANAQYKAGLMRESNESYDKIITKIVGINLNALYDRLSEINEKLFEQFKPSLNLKQIKKMDAAIRNIKQLLDAPNNSHEINITVDQFERLFSSMYQYVNPQQKEQLNPFNLMKKPLQNKQIDSLYTLIKKVIPNIINQDEFKSKFVKLDTIYKKPSRLIDEGKGFFSDSENPDISENPDKSNNLIETLIFILKDYSLTITTTQLQQLIGLIVKIKNDEIEDQYQTWLSASSKDDKGLLSLMEEKAKINKQLDEQHKELKKILTSDIPAKKYNHLNGVSNYDHRKRQEAQQFKNSSRFWSPPHRSHQQPFNAGDATNIHAPRGG